MPNAAAAASYLSNSSFSDDDDDDDADGLSSPTVDPVSRPPTTFQERVASAKLAAASRRSTPAAAAASPALRLARTTSQRQDSLTTLNPDKLANLLSSKTKLCNLVPAGLDTRTSSDAYSDGENSARTPTRNRTKVKRRSHKAAVLASSDDELRRSTKDKEKKSKRRLKVEKIDRLAAAEDDDDKKKVVSSKSNDDARVKQEKEARRGHRKTKKDVVGGETRTMKTRRQRDAADPDTLTVFEQDGYRAPTVLSPRLDAIKKSVERAHKNRRQADRMSQKQAALGGRQRGRGDEELGTRKTLKTDALLVGKTQFVKLKVQVLVVDGWTVVEHASSQHADVCDCHWCSQHHVTTVAACYEHSIHAPSLVTRRCFSHYYYSMLCSCMYVHSNCSFSLHNQMPFYSLDLDYTRAMASAIRRIRRINNVIHFYFGLFFRSLQFCIHIALFIRLISGYMLKISTTG